MPPLFPQTYCAAVTPPGGLNCPDRLGGVNPVVVRRLFRTVAIAEAISWTGLLVGMYIKYVPETTELGVQIFGPIHGGLFVLYCLVTLVAWRIFDWSVPVLLWGLFAAIPPLFTIVFDVWAERRGLLDPERAELAASA
ncbi:DUF3817 domain-containing protein [Aeromicrobium phragmitis]|uniref:DUF3817 domain-containing protein n=1 Tax=Aeromicrobium phragmitis TaxID=2478914 RepID=A0A3L8PRW2_9ACTN|nr:DUF3817 domain-containing protein [Aeromicrobium phragmitis]